MMSKRARRGRKWNAMGRQCGVAFVASNAEDKNDDDKK